MRSKRIFLSFLACFVSSAMVTACGQANPAWVQHATDARIAFNAKDTVEADRQAKLVLAEAGNYGGKMPPSANAPWEANILPMQDLGEHLSYAGNLRSLGTDYAMANKWDEAELFYRKALELDSAKYGADSGVVSRYGLPQLIQFLESRGRTKEAGELQEKLAKALEANAAQAPNPNNAFDQSKAFEARANALESQGKFEEAESYWKKRVDLYKNELSDKARLSTIKQENIKNALGATSIPSTIGNLEDLAGFYRRRKNYSQEVVALSQAQTALESILPADSYFITKGLRDLRKAKENAAK